MSTSLPRVTVRCVVASEASGGYYIITCSCGHQTIRPSRYEADQHATSHRRGCAGGEAA